MIYREERYCNSNEQVVFRLTPEDGSEPKYVAEFIILDPLLYGLGLPIKDRKVTIIKDAVSLEDAFSKYEKAVEEAIDVMTKELKAEMEKAQNKIITSQKIPDLRNKAGGLIV